MPAGKIRDVETHPFSRSKTGCIGRRYETAGAAPSRYAWGAEGCRIRSGFTKGIGGMTALPRTGHHLFG